MPAGKFSMHIKHYKKDQIVKLDRHNRRINKNYSNDQIDPARSGDNVELVKCDGLLKKLNEQINREVRPYGGRITKNSVYCTEAVFTLPQNIEPERARSYFQTILNFLRENGFQVLSAIIHMDETTPHVHVDLSDVRDHKLCRSQIWNKKTLLRLHDEIPQYLRDHGFDVERGEHLDRAGKKKASRDIQKYKADMLEEDIRAMEEIREDLRMGNRELAYDIVAYVEREICR